MANVKISELSAASLPLTGTESIPLVQSGVTVQATAQNIADLAGGGSTANYGVAQILNVTGSPSATYDFTTLFPNVVFSNRTISLQIQIVIGDGFGGSNYGTYLYNAVRNNSGSPFFSYSSAYSSQISGSVINPSFIFSGTESAPTVQFYVSGGYTASFNFTILTTL